MKADRYEEACPKLEESLRLDHGMGTQFNLAHCWEKLGRTASAWALFLDVAAAARAANQPQREAVARERAKALEARLTRLRIDVPDPDMDMTIERDGQDVGRAAWGTAVPVDPGEHVVEVSAPGKQPWSREVDVPAGARVFTVKVPALEDAPLPQAPPDPLDASSPRAPVEASVTGADSGGSNGQSVAAVVIGGVGLAAVATGTFFALQSRSDNSAALELCRTQLEDGSVGCASDPEMLRHRSLVDDAERGRLLGYVGFGVGGAALVTALVLYLTADDGSEVASPGFELTPLWGDHVRGAALTGHF